MIIISLSNRYGKISSNLKVLDSVPYLSSFKAYLISSHLGLIGVIVGTPGVGYVFDGASEYGWFLWVYYCR